MTAWRQEQSWLQVREQTFPEAGVVAAIAPLGMRRARLRARQCL